MSSTSRDNKCRKERDCYEVDACERNVRKSFELSLPITITPFAFTGEPFVCCGGEAKIRHGHKRCDSKRKGHEYTISQIVNIQIPVEFGAEVCYEDYCSEERGRCEDE